MGEYLAFVDRVELGCAMLTTDQPPAFVTTTVCRAKPKGSICLLYKQADTAFCPWRTVTVCTDQTRGLRNRRRDSLIVVTVTKHLPPSQA